MLFYFYKSLLFLHIIKLLYYYVILLIIISLGFYIIIRYKLVINTIGKPLIDYLDNFYLHIEHLLNTFEKH